MPLFRSLRQWLTRSPQGRNLAGKVGLFPESYTQPASPATEPSAPPAIADSPLLSPTPSLPVHELDTFPSLQEPSSPAVTNGDAQPTQPTTANGNGEVMLATMTDVQQAIEQLGHKDDFDGSRSFTYTWRVIRPGYRHRRRRRRLAQDCKIETRRKHEDGCRRTSRARR